MLSGHVAVLVIDTGVVKVQCDTFTACKMEANVSLRHVLCALVAAQQMRVTYVPHESLNSCWVQKCQ